jgi:hypothetical protein
VEQASAYGSELALSCRASLRAAVENTLSTHGPPSARNSTRTRRARRIALAARRAAVPIRDVAVVALLAGLEPAVAARTAEEPRDRDVHPGARRVDARSARGENLAVALHGERPHVRAARGERRLHDLHDAVRAEARVHVTAFVQAHERVISQNFCSCGRMSEPTTSGLTRSVTWLAHSGAKTSYTAA